MVSVIVAHHGLQGSEQFVEQPSDVSLSAVKPLTPLLAVLASLCLVPKQI